MASDRDKIALLVGDWYTDAKIWCGENDVALRVLNDGYHWEFKLPNGRLVEWWPSTGRMVVDKKWGEAFMAMTWDLARLNVEGVTAQ
jgi:hypothetical protein